MRGAEEDLLEGALNPLGLLEDYENEDAAVYRKSLEPLVAPNMWALENVGLYCQYAAAGLLYGSSGTLLPFCAYVYKGESNVCANSSNLTFIAWNFKLLFAVVVDTYHPFGLRRKSWMLFGFFCVLSLLLVLAVACHELSTSEWLGILLVIQLFLMFATVPADGYSIELGQLEPLEQKGQILVTGQRIFFAFCVVAGFIQTLLVNGPTTNDVTCKVSWDGCWTWGLTPNQYYALLFVLVLLLTAPILALKEKRPPPSFHVHTPRELLGEIWATMHNLTTLNILIFVTGIGALTNFTSQVNIFLQYYVISLTNVQAGIDNISTYAALVLAIYLFQTHLINRSWRTTQLCSVIFSATLGLLWIPAYYNLGGLRNAWYTIFIDLDQSFVTGLTQVIYGLAVMELARPGQEATCYELVVTVGNAACALSVIFATQLLSPFGVVGCTSDDDGMANCGENSVNVHSAAAYEASNGPHRFTVYSCTLIAITVVCAVVFVPFLPRGKAECHEWRRMGEARPWKPRPYVTLALCVAVVIYGFAAAVLLLLPTTSCLAVVGGEGC